MWFEKIAGLVAGQIALTVLLAAVLWQLWARLRREQHVAFWSLSWAVVAVYVIFLSLYVLAFQYGGAHATELAEISLAGVSLGWFQPALLMLAAWSVRSGRVSGRDVLLTNGVAILVGGVWTVVAWTHHGWIATGDLFQRLQVIVAPRTFLEAAGIAGYAVFFGRYHARARGFSGWLTIVSALAYSVHLLLVALGDIGIRPYGDPNGTINSTIANIVPMGITLGIVISVLEQAQHSEGAMRSVWNSSVAMRLTNAEGYVVSVNPAFCGLMGCPKEQMEGRLFTECYDRATADAMLECYRDKFASRAFEARRRFSFQRRDGKLLEADVTNAFVESPAGPQLLALMQDTTREHDALQALQRSEERLRLLLDSITDAVFVFRTDGSTLERYTRFRETLGYEVDELPDTLETWLGLMHPDDRAALPENPLNALPTSGNLAQWEYRLRDKTGRWVWIRSAVKVIEWDDAGRPARVVGTMTDISEYKASEAQARHLENELLQTRKMEAIGRLAGGVAHDFNNHLTVINGYCDLMLNQPADSVVRDKLQKIRAAGGRAAALTQQLLAVSRRQTIQPQRVRLNLLVAELGAMLQRLIGENIEIVTSLDDNLGLVEVDPGQMHQVLMNLTLNARDAMPGGGRILIETANQAVEATSAGRPQSAPPGIYARLSVRDNGHGISAETLEHIFEPFFTTKRAGAGTGLGLSTAYGIVQQAGGWVEVESQAGQGSTFRVYLPIVEKAHVAEAPALPAAEFPTGTETVLIVEDQADLRRVAAEILREQGYRMLEAEGGDQALSVSASHSGPIHLLFTDIILPGVSGPELARLFRERRPATRVLFTSGYPTESRPIALSEGAILLSKPFSPAELCIRVRAVLDGPERPRTTLVANDLEQPHG